MARTIAKRSDPRRKYFCEACKVTPRPSRSCPGCLRLKYRAFEKKRGQRGDAYWRAVNERRREYLARYTRANQRHRTEYFKAWSALHPDRIKIYESRARYGKEFAEAHRALVALTKGLKDLRKKAVT